MTRSRRSTLAAVSKAREEKEGGVAGLGLEHKGEAAGRWADPDRVPSLRRVAIGTGAAAVALRQAGRRNQGERRRAGRPTGGWVQMGAWDWEARWAVTASCSCRCGTRVHDAAPSGMGAGEELDEKGVG
jgi:hypothetical protein